ncbi:WXG100 family type VII secretion target [Corynebacterium hansenii]|uniref:ESAT-6-like protein n=1 Tax=Corynebacterium hansenii TaxID=394964 RepID=A0ABV7ZNU0_9CORY|nr:WXG100 family type VII secretion target [Corynebacterium hansenii]WJY99048.1 WXG domain conatining protein [Corynebacterium hansenii]
MTDGIFTTESGTMKTTAGDVDGVNQEVSGELSRLRGVVDGLAGEWKGQAKQAFDDLMIRWDEAAAKLSGALTDIAENIRANAGSFDDGEETGVADLNRVSASGGGLLNL